MDSKETHQQQQNRNAAAALADPTSTSQAVHNRSSLGALSMRQPQPPQQALDLNASPYSVATQQPWMQPGTEQQRATTKYAPPDVIDGGDSGGGAEAGPPTKRSKGRPPGSRNKNRHNALGRGPVTAHVIDINAGEDIAKEIAAFVNQEPRDVCILSATGAISSAVFQTKNPIGLLRLEGEYVITSMSGTFSKTESNGTVTRTGNLYMSMAGPDYMVVGGCVRGGMLEAGSQVQVIVGVYGPEGVKLSSASSAPANALSLSGGGGPGFPQSQGQQRSSESSEENASTSLGNSTPQPPRHLPL